MIEIYKIGSISIPPSKYEHAFIANNKMLNLSDNTISTEAAVYPWCDRGIKVEWILD